MLRDKQMKKKYFEFRKGHYHNYFFPRTKEEKNQTMKERSKKKNQREIIMK